MNKRGWMLAIGVLLLATVFAGTAVAEYGEWELRCQYGLIYNQSALLSLSAVDAEHLFTTSVHQDGATSAQRAHFSTDGGYSWQTWRHMEAGIRLRRLVRPA